MSAITREKPWLCFACGYKMDAAAPIDPTEQVTPGEGDWSLCMNCGAVYTRHRDQWLPMTDAERAALTPDERVDLDRAGRSRSATIKSDLARGRGGRA